MTNTYQPVEISIQLVIARRFETGRLTIEVRPAAERAGLGEPGKQAGDVTLAQTTPAEPRIIVSLGSAEKISTESYRRAGGGLARWLVEHGVSAAQMDLDDLGVDVGKAALLEGLLLGAFRFDRYKKPDPDRQVVTLHLVSTGQRLANEIERAQKLATAVNLARDWAHEPANVINPVTLAERLAELAGQYGLKINILDDCALAEMGAGAIQAVGKGSKTPSRLITLEYPGQDAPPDAPPVALVGKAITFDTGGYSMKDGAGMVGMKYDKCGAMAVVGTLVAAAELKLRQPVVGVIAAAENLASGESYRPDDILKTLSGKTVEIISTDAEGRLVLADALTYTQNRFHPRSMIDLATLTGGVVVALGTVRAGILSNEDTLAERLYTSGERTFERLWRLPLDEEYEQQIKGDDGDIKNSAGRQASPIIGGTFLKMFVEPGVPWAHLDIAGTADTDKDLPYCQKGATGFGVRLLVDYLEHLD